MTKPSAYRCWTLPDSVVAKYLSGVASGMLYAFVANAGKPALFRFGQFDAARLVTHDVHNEPCCIAVAFIYVIGCVVVGFAWSVLKMIGSHDS